MSEFWEKYKDPRWQKKRLEIMQHASFACEHCGSTTTTLNVHHKWYAKDTDPWDYPELSLICLCEGCHELWHKAKDNLNVAIQFYGLDGFTEVVGYAIGLAVHSPECRDDATIYFRYGKPSVGIAAALGLHADEVEALRDSDGGIRVGAIRRLIESKGQRR